LKEVQDASQDLAKFGKMVKLVSFAPYRLAEIGERSNMMINEYLEEQPKLSRTSILSPKVSYPNISNPTSN
jgi:nucleolar protein 56